MMQIHVAGQGGVKESREWDRGKEEWGLLGSLAFLPGSASQLQRGGMEFKTPGKTFSLGLNIV